MRVLEPGPTHLKDLRAACDDGQIVRAMITDTHVAALAIEYGATLWSFDKDFGRFSRLRGKSH